MSHLPPGLTPAAPTVDEAAAVDPVALEARLEDLSTEAMLRLVLRDLYPGRIAVVSSFGAESAVLLDLVARIDPATPVLFIDTLRHFPETLRYVKDLTEHLGLTDVRRISPDPLDAEARDPVGDLCRRDHDTCCRLRKVEPLAYALSGFDAWISGRKRYHGAERSSLKRVEWSRARVKFNPLADWDGARIEAAFDDRRLPRHPMVEDGFLSIGCMPCTMRAACASDPRSGRWTGTEKTECGIHLPCADAKS